MFPKVSKLKGYDELGMRMIERKMQLLDELSMQDSSERVEGGEPATMKASEKSEALLEGAGPISGASAGGPTKTMVSKDDVKKSSETKAPNRSASPAKSAAAGRRSRRSTATSGRAKK